MFQRCPQRAFQRSGLFGAGIDDDEGDISVGDDRGAAFEGDALVHGATSVANGFNRSQDFQHLTHVCGAAIVDVDIDQGEGITVFWQVIQIALAFQKTPASLLQKFQIPGVVDVAVQIEMVSPYFDFDGVAHGLLPLWSMAELMRTVTARPR